LARQRELLPKVNPPALDIGDGCLVRILVKRKKSAEKGDEGSVHAMRGVEPRECRGMNRGPLGQG